MRDKNSKKKSDIMISIRVDKETKEQAQVIFEELGLDTSGAIKIFLRKVINCGSMPFILHGRSVELKNMEEIKIDKQNKMKRALHKMSKKNKINGKN